MKRLSDYTRFWSAEDDADVVRRLLKQWQPTQGKISEKEHEQQLAAWLKQQLPDVPLVVQYGIAKGRADIVIQDEHAIELKLAFTEESVGEFDRCLGQLWRYKEKWARRNNSAYVWLVVVGESEAEYRDLLHKWFREANEAFSTVPLFSRKPLEFVEKTLS